MKMKGFLLAKICTSIWMLISHPSTAPDAEGCQCYCRLWGGILLKHLFQHQKQRFSLKRFARNGISMSWTEKKSPLLSFLVCQINPSAFPICLSLRAAQWACSQTGVIKKTSTKQRTSRDCQGSLIWTPVPTQWVVSLPFSFSSSLLRGGWNMCNMEGWCRRGHQSHATTQTPLNTFPRARREHISVRDILTRRFVARWKSKFIT